MPSMVAMKLDLSGLQVVITRPEEQAQAWAKQLEALGATTIVTPMLAIQALSKSEDTQAITTTLLKLDEYQKALFVSQNAVNYACEWIDRYWPQLPQGLAFFAIGEATAQLLEKKLEHLGALVEAPQQAMNSEALLNLDALQRVAGEKIVIFRGVGGRTHLGKSLEARGALIDYCELYQRVIPDKFDENKISSLIDSQQAAVISVHSGETLENLCTRLSELQLRWAKQQTLLLPGERVAGIAKTLGFSKLIIAENATHESMIGALNDWRK